ncbi:MAG: hypothetical protein GYB68_11010, partial [Chloroflexi bacterium]|nr:hypothetical protein [Chloroflexota bacterium]
EPYGLLRTDREPRPAYTAYDLITTHYRDVDETLHFETQWTQQVVLARNELTTRVLWSRTPQTWRVRVPALAEQALMIDQAGNEQVIKPDAFGGYVIELGPATHRFFEPDYTVGGPPILIVEEAPANLARPASLQAQMLNAAFSRRQWAGIAVVGTALMGIALGIVWAIKRESLL